MPIYVRPRCFSGALRTDRDERTLCESEPHHSANDPLLRSLLPAWDPTLFETPAHCRNQPPGRPPTPLVSRTGHALHGGGWGPSRSPTHILSLTNRWLTSPVVRASAWPCSPPRAEMEPSKERASTPAAGFLSCPRPCSSKPTQRPFTFRSNAQRKAQQRWWAGLQF